MRYLLIDMDKVRSGECNINNPDNFVRLNLDLAILSEEESLAKFKEIWNRAFYVGKYINMLDSEEQEWEQFKQTI